MLQKQQTVISISISVIFSFVLLFSLLWYYFIFDISAHTLYSLIPTSLKIPTISDPYHCSESFMHNEERGENNKIKAFL